MKKEVLYSNYNEESGVTSVIIHNKYGTFSAQALCHNEDRDIQNRWDGFRVCEYKIYMATLKVKYRLLLERYKGIKDALNVAIRSGKAYKTEESYLLTELLENQAKTAKREADKVKNQYKNMRDNKSLFYEKLASTRREFQK